MFIIQQRKSSIFLTELMIILLELTLVDKSFSNQRICENSNTRDISYFQAGSRALVWTEAWSLCNNNGSALPVICNQHEQDALANFLKATLGGSKFWTSGKKTSLIEWQWIDGQLFNNRSAIREQHDTYTNVVIHHDRSYTAQNPTRESYYLCRYSASSCNSENDIRLTNGCVRPSDDDRTWYDARNQCLKSGGDLAILADADLETLKASNKLNSVRSYWIGLRKNAWYWSRGTTVPSDVADEEMTFTNWLAFSNSETDNCLFIDARSVWIAERCNTAKKVICQTSSAKMTSSKSSSTMTSTTATESQVLLYSGIGAGIVIIITCIIVIILALRFTRKSHKDMNQSVVTNNSGHDKLYLAPTKRTTLLTDTSVSAPVARADDTQGIYAEISLIGTVNEPENGAKPQQPGIVYASLDFEKEPNYQEVN